MQSTVLITGGAGYIGAHACVELVAAGHEVVLLDNLSHSRRSAIARLEKLCGRPLAFHEGDIRDRPFLRRVFAAHRIQAVMHFAGLKSVAESARDPVLYYENNVSGTLTLLQAMEEHAVRRIIFSSSATVYGETTDLPLAEESALAPVSPYGHTKLVTELIISDLLRSTPGWKAVLLRYFNAVSSHASGLIGDDPQDPPRNLMPYVTQVAAGRLPALTVFGNDYPTPDGTGIRDYIHVTDLVRGHVAALHAFEKLEPLSIFNLGTGRGCSVLELVGTFERATGAQVPYRIAPRRAGDLAAYYADPRRAREKLGWKADRDLETMCRDAWRWQQWCTAHAAEL